MGYESYFIVGGGGLGREVKSWLLQTPEWASAVFLGFLDDTMSNDNPFQLLHAGGIAVHKPDSSSAYFCAIGDPRARLRIAHDLRAKGARFPILCHPTVVIGDGCRIGEGCVLCPGAIITANVQLGEFVIVNAHASIGHDARIGNGCTLSGHCDVTGYASLDEGVFLGSHASVLPRARVGAYAKVGAGSVVLKSVNPGATVMGVPAKQILP